MSQFGWVIVVVCCLFAGLDLWLMKITRKRGEIVALLERNEQ
jgi:hypothetical protein